MSESEKVEYEASIELYKNYMNSRRKDMAFNTTAQVALLAYLRDKLFVMDISSYIIVFVAFILLYIAFNNERCLVSYMQAYIKRGIEIENLNSMKLLGISKESVKKNKFILSNRIAFPLYYSMFFILWIGIIAINLLV